MPRKRKQKVKVNNVESLEGLLQETYNEACGNINSAQKEITKLDAVAEPEVTDDHVKMTKEKGNLLKIKDSAIRIKLEVAKLQNDTIKQNGDVERAVADYSGQAPTDDDLAMVRKMINDKKMGVDKKD
jgi:hypothetical protein